MKQERIEAGTAAPGVTRRHMIIGGALLATAVGARALVPHNNIDLLGKDQLEDIVPEKIGQWEFASKSGLVVPPQDQLADKLYAQMLTRVYVAANALPMMLLIAQSPGQDGVLQIHRPEVCYPASGYALQDGGVHQIPLGNNHSVPTRMFIASSNDRVEQLLYWTRIGTSMPTNWLEQRTAVAEANLRGDIPDAVLVRISTVSADANAMRQIDAFARATIASMAPAKRPVLVGNATA